MTAFGDRDDTIITSVDTSTARRSLWRGLCCCLRDKQGLKATDAEAVREGGVGGKKHPGRKEPIEAHHVRA